MNKIYLGFGIFGFLMTIFECIFLVFAWTNNQPAFIVFDLFLLIFWIGYTIVYTSKGLNPPRD